MFYNFYWTFGHVAWHKVYSMTSHGWTKREPNPTFVQTFCSKLIVVCDETYALWVWCWNKAAVFILEVRIIPKTEKQCGRIVQIQRLCSLLSSAVEVWCTGDQISSNTTVLESRGAWFISWGGTLVTLKVLIFLSHCREYSKNCFPIGHDCLLST